MIETDNSNTNKAVCLRIIAIIIMCEFIISPELPKSVKSKCPAIMLAVSRIARVIGRITILIDSIITINGIRIGGVPIGVKWAIVSLKKFISL